MTHDQFTKEYVSRASGFDIIGDIHGHADALVTLLGKLGYEKREGVWAHSERRAIFVGDLIDRGPKQRETCETVKAMVDAGYADICIGNHELNAVAYATLGVDGNFLRKHSEKNNKQHASFVKEYPAESKAQKEVISWFKSLPLWLELETPNQEKAHVIHACWDPTSMRNLTPYLQQGARGFVLGEAFDHQLFESGTEAFELVERLLKGPEMKMPEGAYFVDKSGHKRSMSRIAWWKRGETWAESGVFGVGEERIFGIQLSDPLPEPVEIIYDGEEPVFFGHYWMKREYGLPSPKAACTDWSIAKKGRLAAYRWDGEQTLSMDKFVSVAYDEFN